MLSGGKQHWHMKRYRNARSVLLPGLICALAIGCGDDSDDGPQVCEASDAGAPIPAISPTRQLRRVTLSLAQRAPTDEEYERVLAAGDADAQRGEVFDIGDALLDSPDFYRSMVNFGHDWIPVTKLRTGVARESYWGSQAANLFPCADGTLHAGALRIGGESVGDSPSCDDASVAVNSVEPWWAPGTTVETICAIGEGNRSVGDIDCGLSVPGYYDRGLPHEDCSCGPNLIYCHPNGGVALLRGDHDPALPLRQAWDEPARLLAHIAWHDRPLSDLILGNYSVAPRELQHVYYRMGRQDSEHDYLDDDDSWWRGSGAGAIDPLHEDPTDPLAWREFVVESLDPFLMSLTDGVAGADGRFYHHDPRATLEPMEGVPAAGALTTLAVQSAFPRERVRAARMLETFACQSFVPPPAGSTFGEVGADIAKTGPCQFCHRVMDPAAIHFKRWSFGYGYIQQATYHPGIGPWDWSNPDSSDLARFEQLYTPSTLLTPATAEEIETNPDARMLDFLGPEYELYGATSDGTNGPLGFAKLLVESGRFDECAARKLYERFAGRTLDPAQEAGFISTLTDDFVNGGRRVRPFVAGLLRRPDFLHGALGRTP